jgi:regulator of replication initiation timing
MDVETTGAIETLRGDMTSLDSKLERVRTSIESKIEEVRTSLDSKIEEVRTSLDLKIEGVRTSLDSKIEQKTAEAMTHACVLNEAVRDDVRLVAEAVAVLTVKVDALREAR